MRNYPRILLVMILLAWLHGNSTPGGMLIQPAHAEDAPSARYTRLAPIPRPAIVDKAAPYKGGQFEASNLFDNNLRSEYSSDGKGTETFIELDLGSSIPIAALRYVDRNDPATIATSELILIGEDGKANAAIPLTHTGEPGGILNAVFPSPVSARRARWHVRKLGPSGLTTVGGAEMQFFTTSAIDPAPTEIALDVSTSAVLERKNGGCVQPIRMALDYPYQEASDAIIRLDDCEPVTRHLSFGKHVIDLDVPKVPVEKKSQIRVEIGGTTIARREITLKPVRQSTIYILPHSHVDIGYTELQTDVERKQISNIARGIELARTTANHPEGSRFKWNVEVLWAVDSYLRQSPPEKQKEFVEAVQKGWIGLDAMYANELTGLCRPEELIRLFRYATQLSRRCGVPIESAMISDVPGYTWGIVPAMAQAGVRYWSIGPNYFDRMGYTIANWENLPFYWVGPSGRDKILCWMPYQGYAISHILQSNMTEKFVCNLMNHLEKIGYPYDLIHLRWSGHGDNAVPDEKIPDFVKSWNERYESPRLVIATTSEAFREFEKRHGDKLPRYHGDWTPYWEDGAGSSARETAINRASAERLVQAETLWAMLNPPRFPAAEFQEAWRNVLLYSEHTWGAHNSITEPESQFVKDQWKIKQAFALDGETQSLRLLQSALGSANKSDSPADCFTVLNTCSWSRTDTATIPKSLSSTGDVVVDSGGRTIPSQRLNNGDLLFVAGNLPPFSAQTYRVQTGTPAIQDRVTIRDLILDNGLLSVRLDSKTGAIVELRTQGSDINLADNESIALNDYFFVAGSDTQNPLRCGDVRITVGERGPLAASLLVEAEAPGCNKLTREIRLIAGLDRVEIINTIDKTRAEVHGKRGDWKHAGQESKEGLHFGFAFHIPDGVMRMDVPWAVVRPETDQLPGACKNWFTVQRWVDVSNDQYGVTWATIDAPLVEVGTITANLLGSQNNPKAWIHRLEPTQTLYSWVMNNHWHTNYRAYQEGATTFRYAIRPHRGYKPDEAARFGTSISQPLLVANGALPTVPGSRPRVEPPEVLVTAWKPSDDGKAWILRLFGASGRNTQTTIRWTGPGPTSLWLSNTAETAVRKINGEIEVPAWGVVTLRAGLTGEN